jgi:hypothetical protein
MLTTDYLTTIFVNTLQRERRAEAESHRDRRIARRRRAHQRQHPGSSCA